MSVENVNQEPVQSEESATTETQSEQAPQTQEQQAQTETETNPNPLETELEALKAQLAELEELKAKVAEAEALKAQLAELETEKAAQAEQLETQKKAMKEAVLANLGVKERFRSFAPDVDPTTKEGQRALEQWAQDNPELLDGRVNRKPTTEIKRPENVKNAALIDFDLWNKIRAKQA